MTYLLVKKYEGVVDIIKNRPILLLISLLCAALILSGCGGGSDGSGTDLTDLNVKVKDMEGQGIPMVNLSVKDESGTKTAVTNDLGTVSFSNLNLTQDEIYQVEAEDYITRYADLTAGDDFVSIVFDSADLILFDDFSDTSSGWPIRVNDKPVRSEYIDGKYEVEISENSYLDNINWPDSEIGITDFAISADFELVSGSGGYGFMVNLNNSDSYLSYSIINYNSIKILLIRNQDKTYLEKDIAEYIENGKSNTFMVVCNSVNSRVYIDGNLISDIDFPTSIPSDTSLKLIVGSSSSEPLPTVTVDNFRLLELN